MHSPFFVFQPTTHLLSSITVFQALQSNAQQIAFATPEQFYYCLPQVQFACRVTQGYQYSTSKRYRSQLMCSGCHLFLFCGGDSFQTLQNTIFQSIFVQIRVQNLTIRTTLETQQTIIKMLQENQKQVKTEEPRQCPYLATIKRHLIDFDVEQVCCVTLSNNNIYACLICGKYFQGKGISTPAFQHSISVSHHLFINLATTKVYCLPENYQVVEHTLKDIKFNLQPKYQTSDFQKLYQYKTKYNIDGKQYTPGIIGINNLKQTDYLNATLQVLNAIAPFRQFFLINSNFKDNFLQKFALFFKKLWNYQQFKGSICPHELMHAITQKSGKLYKIGKKSDPVNFFVWLIDNLSRLLKKQKNSLNVSQLFQGSIKTSYIKGIKNSAEYESIPSSVQQKKFTIIRLQFQQRGIFNKVEDQVDIKDLMQYYLGLKGKVQGEGLIYIKITQFPRYLVIVFKRFSSNDYNVEKNTTQVLYSGNLEIEGHKYRLIGQICHQGNPQTGSYKAAVKHGQKWFEAEDLVINQVLKKQMLLGEPYIQIYQKVV